MWRNAHLFLTSLTLCVRFLERKESRLCPVIFRYFVQVNLINGNFHMRSVQKQSDFQKTCMRRLKSKYPFSTERAANHLRFNSCTRNQSFAFCHIIGVFVSNYVTIQRIRNLPTKWGYLPFHKAFLSHIILPLRFHKYIHRDIYIYIYHTLTSVEAAVLSLLLGLVSR